MRVVPDTNVLVSAIVFGGPPARLVELAAEGYLVLVLSPPVIDELRAVLRRKFGFSDAAAYQAETLLRRIGVVVEPQREIAIIREDPEDNRVLEAALAGNADVIVSGDRHLLALGEFGAVPIMSPRELLDKIVPDT
jgi:putative PIN family toxin of toxin-antitoxin system